MFLIENFLISYSRRGDRMSSFYPQKPKEAKTICRTCRIRSDLDKRVAELVAKHQMSYSEVVKQCIAYAFPHMEEK